jgi:hypothetical protein
MATHLRVYFRISLKRGQTHRSKLQGGGGANINPRRGNPTLNIGKANLQRGINPKGGKSTPCPPEINPASLS